jgi:glycosyltransferase involved in cell wall biosynthesis
MALWESFCNVVHEGMSQGLVCIVADNTALPYLVKNDVNGYCLPDQDVTQLSEKLTFVLKNKNTKKIKEMEEKNREFGLRDSWRSVSDKLIATYRKEINR